MLVSKLSRVVLVAVLLAGPSVSAATLVSYDFSSGLSPSSWDPGVTASSITVSSSSYSTSAGNLDLSVPGQGGSMSFYFTLTPVNPVDLSSLSTQIWASDNSGNLRFALDYQFQGDSSWRSSIAQTVLTNTQTLYTGTLADQNAVLNRTIVPITFRYTAWNFQRPTKDVYFDNIGVSGVPAPPAAILLLGGLGFEALRRRRNKRRTEITNERD